tara:strand:+ start:141 stop:467 length:327 start_codon:yes stop_codon:yes gene_type:complete
MRFDKNVLPIVRDALRSPELSRILEANFVIDRQYVEEVNKGWNDDNKPWSDPLILSQAHELGLVNLVGEAEYALCQVQEIIDEQTYGDDKQLFYTDKRRLKKFLKKWR